MLELPSIDVLASDINKQWGKSNYSPNEFSKVAFSFLSDFHLSKLSDYKHIAEKLMLAENLCPQSSLGNSFGQPPLTLYTDDRFRIEMLLWHTGAATIHHHTFSGAFALVSGSTLHSLYQFKNEKKHFDHFCTGDVLLDHYELMSPGDVRIINPGQEMIHSTFHLDTPSVTLIIRTHSHPSFPIEYEYRPPGIAIDTRYVDPVLTKKIQVIEFLQTIKSTNLEFLLRLGLEKQNNYVIYMLLRQYFKYRAVTCENDIITRLENEHPSLSKRLLASINEEKRRLQILRLRALVSDPDQRFFLAVLMHLPDLQSIQDVIKSRYPAHDSLKLILKWCEDISLLNNPEGDGGIFKKILSSLLNKENLNTLHENIERCPNLESQSANKIQGVYQSIKESPILKPLFR